MKELGLCMKHNAEALDRAIRAVPPVDVFNYVELGVYNGETMMAVTEHLDRNRRPFKSFGVESRWWAKDHADHAASVFTDYWDRTLKEGMIVKGDIDNAPLNKISMYPIGSGAFLKDSGVVPHLTFIDGCHSFRCCATDFLLVEMLCPVGGVVMIHDLDENIQGKDPHPHCQEGINVLKACQWLGLMPMVTRPGWRRVILTPGGHETHQLLVVQKTHSHEMD